MIKIVRLRLAVITGLACILVGCGQTATGTNSPTAVATTLPATTTVPVDATEPIVVDQPTQEELPPMTPAPNDSIAPGFQNLIDQAKADLAQRLSIPTSQIELIEAKDVVWPDASIGCPQPGMMYIQVPQDGALIVLQVEGKHYEYHTGGKRALFLCETINKAPLQPTQIDIQNLTPATPDNSIPPGADQ